MAIDDRTSTSDAIAHEPHAHDGTVPGERHKGHSLVIVFLIALGAYSLLPIFGIGMYSNASGQRLFEMWYLLGFMVIAFFLIHEFITPMPPKEQK